MPVKSQVMNGETIHIDNGETLRIGSIWTVKLYTHPVVREVVKKSCSNAAYDCGLLRLQVNDNTNGAFTNTPTHRGALQTAG